VQLVLAKEWEEDDDLEDDIKQQIARAGVGVVGREQYIGLQMLSFSCWRLSWAAKWDDQVGGNPGPDSTQQ
jgi:hypothetical protein